MRANSRKRWPSSMRTLARDWIRNLVVASLYGFAKPAIRNTRSTANLGPLEKAPFYDVELAPTESSSAGLYTDIHGRVMHLRGHAILGLYAGGTVRVRTEYGGGYQAGLTLLGGMTFGRIAVEHTLLSDKKRS